MATASPTPAGSNQYSAPSRKASLRSGLRNAPSRTQLDRAQANPAPPAHASSRAQYAGHHADSSDDEIPVPMKLSAITKALLNEDGPAESAPAERGPSRVRTRAQSHRPLSPGQPVLEQDKSLKRRSVLASSVGSVGEEKRHTRANSSQLSSRPNSPVRSQASENSPVQKSRKRVVRLSTTPGTGVQFGTVQPSKRRSTSMSTSQRGNRPASREGAVEERANVSEIQDVNTPVVQGIKSVRITTGSSGGRSRLSGSSGMSSRRADSVSYPPSENEAPEDPAARQNSVLGEGSGSRLRSREEENQAMQSSMRVKRVGKVTGSFLRGPARRGLRRQSEEDGGNDVEPLAASQEEAESQAPPEVIDLDPIDHYASSFYAPDRVASGSPVSSARRREASLGYEEPRLLSQRNSPEREVEEIPIPQYRAPAPRPDVPSRNDQENEALSSFKKSKVLDSSIIELEVRKLPARPRGTSSGALKPLSPERKPLASVSQNEPRRNPPAPPPKMSILEAATSTAGAATTQQAAKKRNYLKVNGKYYTRLDSLGRGGSAKVYRVAADNGKMFALKRVSIENADETTVRGYKGEIDLLRKLSGVERVINLYDFEMNEEKQVLSLVRNSALPSLVLSY
jgi:serine/threonine-protein kinase TTK/MPS1